MIIKAVKIWYTSSGTNFIDNVIKIEFLFGTIFPCCHPYKLGLASGGGMARQDFLKIKRVAMAKLAGRLLPTLLVFLRSLDSNLIKKLTGSNLIKKSTRFNLIKMDS